MAVSKDDIIKAAEALTAKGINPSMKAVREILGSGSFATISPVLREWRNQREKITSIVVEMPSEMRASIERTGAEIWKTANGLAGQQLEQFKTSSLEQIESANTDRDEALEEVESLEAKIIEQESTENQLNELLKQAEQALRTCQEKAAALTQRTLDLEDQTKQQQQQLELTREQNQQQQSRIEQLQSDAAIAAKREGQPQF